MSIKNFIYLLAIAIIGGIIVVSYEHDTYDIKDENGNKTEKNISDETDKASLKTDDEYRKIQKIGEEFELLIDKLYYKDIKEAEKDKIYNQISDYGKKLNNYYKKYNDCRIGKKLLLFYEYYIQRLKEEGRNNEIKSYQNAYNKIKNNCH